MPRANAASLVAVGLLLVGVVRGESREERLAQARQLAKGGRAIEAAEVYQQLYDDSAGDLSLRFQLAVARQMAGQFEAAVEHSRAVAEQRPDFPPAWLFLGAALLKSGQGAEAIEPLRRALSLGVSDASAPLMLGEALLQAGQAREAGEQFLAASNSLAENPRVWYGLERACSTLVSLENKISEPGCADSSLACLYHQGRFADVARQARERLALLPPSSQHHELLARDLDARGMSREAVEHWRRALELDPTSDSLKKGLAAALRLSRDCEGALPLLEDLVQRQPQSGELFFLQGDCLLSLEQARDSVKPLQRAIELDGSLLQASGRLGAAYVKLEEFSPAVEALKRALPADEDGSFHYLLARAYRALGRNDEARATLENRRRLRDETP